MVNREIGEAFIPTAAWLSLTMTAVAIGWPPLIIAMFFAPVVFAVAAIAMLAAGW